MELCRERTIWMSS
jgi:hypothetical protein